MVLPIHDSSVAQFAFPDSIDIDIVECETNNASVNISNDESDCVGWCWDISERLHTDVWLQVICLFRTVTVVTLSALYCIPNT